MEVHSKLEYGKVLVNPHTYLGVSFWDRTQSKFSRWAYVVKNAIGELGLTITDNGFFGIGTKTPVATLTVQGASTSTPTFAITDVSANPNLVVTGEGNIGIGTFTPTSVLHISAPSPRLTLSDTSTTTKVAYLDWFVESRDGSFGVGLTGSSTALTIDGAGDVNIGDVSADGRTANLTVSGAVFATSYQVPQSEVTSFTLGSTASTSSPQATFTAEIPSDVLTADGKGVDIYKLATFTLSGVQALASTTSALGVRLTSLEDRVAALENGSISTASGSPLALSSSALASVLEGFGVLIQKGIAQFNTLVFRQLVASKDADGTSSAGSVIIPVGSALAQVTNSLVFPSTKIFFTFNSVVAGSWWVLTRLPAPSGVVLSAPQTTDVSFDYSCRPKGRSPPLPL